MHTRSIHFYKRNKCYDYIILVFPKMACLLEPFRNCIQAGEQGMKKVKIDAFSPGLFLMRVSTEAR